MKIKNIEMVRFLNATDGLVKKKLPTRLMYAVDCNIRELGRFVQAYQDAYEKARAEGQEELSALLNQEIEATLQTIPPETMDIMDRSDKFDALTGEELSALLFMIKK